MKLTVSVSELKAALAICAQVPVQKDANKKELPRNLLLQRDGERLKVSAANPYDGVWCSAWISLDSNQGEIRFLISTVAMVEICRHTDEETITIEWNESGDAVVAAGSNEWRLPLGDPATFAEPEVNMPSKSPSVFIYGAVLAKLLGRVRHAAATETARFAMTSVYLTTRGGLSCVATDGRQLAVADAGDQFEVDGQGANEVSCLIPQQALPLLRLESVDQVRVRISKTHIIFEVSRSGAQVYEVACSQVNGRFPDYTAVIPSENKLGNAYQHESRVLLAAINKVAFLANTDDEANCHRVRFEHHPGRLEVKSTSGAGAAKVLVSCECESSSSIQFNYKYLKNALKEINGPVTLYISKPDLPMVLKSEGLLQLIMPLS